MTMVVEAILAMAMIAYEVTSQSVIYVSKVDGNDSTTCGSQNSPCYSISQAVSQAQFGSSIYLNSTNTTVSPYNCQPWTSYQKGIYITKALSFIGGPSLAHVSCRKGQNWIVDGTQSPIPIDVNLTSIAFENSRLHFIETTVAVKHCIFSNTETLVMNFTIVHRNLTFVSFKNVRFEANEACILIASRSMLSEIKQSISININDSVFHNNVLRRFPIWPSSLWTILDVDTSRPQLVDIQIRNSSFKSNGASYLGMIDVQNQLGYTEILIQDVHFTENGLVISGRGNSLFLLSGSVVSFEISGSKMKKNKQRLLSTYSTWAKISVSYTTVNNFVNYREHGGIFSIQSNIIRLLIKHCFVSNGNNNGHGGLLYVSGHDAHIFIESSTLTKFSTSGYGGVIFVTFSPIVTASLKLSLKNSSFLSNVAMVGGVMYAYSANAIANKRDSGLVVKKAHAKKPSSFEILIKRTEFENNAANMAGVIYLQGINGVFVSGDSIFRYNIAHLQGGALMLKVSNSTIKLVNTTFFNNTSKEQAGGAVFLNIRLKNNVHIDHAKFERNFALQSFGGGLDIITSGDRLYESGCRGKMWRTWNYSNFVEIKNTHFLHNSAGRGGAISITNGLVNFTNCNFFNNISPDQGSHIINYGTNSLNLMNSTFQQTTSSYASTFVQSNSAGPLTLINTTVNHQGSWSIKTLFSVSKGGLVKFNNLTSILCPSGMFASWLNLSYTQDNWINNSSCSLNVTILRLQCTQCERGKYSLQRGHTKGFRIHDKFMCLPCPYGAECLPQIESKPNFWGYLVHKNPPSLKFTLCPDGYCLLGRQTPDGYSNSCNGNRENWMCGRCAFGYSETLFSPNCKKSEHCNDNWFWLVFLAIVFAMALFLVFKQPIVTFAAKQAFWFKNYFGTKEGNVIADAESLLQTEQNEFWFKLPTEKFENKNSKTVGFLEIIFYFYQISNLLLTSTSWEQLLKTKIVIPIQGFFNFRGTFFASEGLVCPFPGLTPETKQLFEVAPVFGTLGAIYFIYAVHFTISKILHTATPTLGRYLGATMETILLGYIKIATVSLSLVRCTPVGNESRWFYNGTIVCYQWWQKVLIAFDVMVVVPFIFVLAWGAVKLHRAKVSAKHFLLACVFPLPFLILWLLQSLGFYGNQRQQAQSTEYTKALKDVLLAPFRKPEAEKTGALYWQSIFILRRLVLVFLYCFITAATFRLFCMGVVCVLALIHHSKMKPFQNNRANTGETVSLLALVILANINSYKSFYANSQEEIINSWMPVLDWVEIILLGFLPAIFALMVVFVSISLITRLIFVVCSVCICEGIQRGLKRSSERAPLLNN